MTITRSLSYLYGFGGAAGALLAQGWWDNRRGDARESIAVPGLRLPPMHYLVGVLLAALAYAGLDAASGALAGGPHAIVVLFGMHDGFALALLLLAGVRYWPALLLGGLIARYFDASFSVALPQAIGNVLQGLAGWLLVVRVNRRPVQLERWRDSGVLVLFGAVVSTAVSPLVNIVVLLWSGQVVAAEGPIVWLNDWLGAAVGVLVVTPFILAYSSAVIHPRRATYFAEAGALLLLSAIMAAIVFAPVFRFVLPHQFRYAFLLLPLVVWGASRFEARGATALCLLIALVALMEGQRGAAGAASMAHEEFVLMVSLFLIVTTGTGLVVAASSAERRQTGALRNGLNLLRQVFDAVPLAVRTADAEGRITSANAAAEDLGLYDAPASKAPGWIGAERRALQPGDWPLARVLESGSAVYNEQIEVSVAGGSRKTLLCSAVPLRNAAGGMIGAVGVKQDLSELLEAQAHALRLAKAREVISRCIRILIHAADERQMLDEMCRVVVEVGGYALALVGVAQPDAARTVRFVAEAPAGHRAAIEALNVSWADDERGRGPTGTALRTGKPSVVQEVVDDPGTAVWNRFHAERGIRATAAFPFRFDADHRAALSINSALPGAFTEAEIELFEELAGDIGFGLRALRAERDLRDRQARLLTAERVARTGFIDWNLATNQVELSNEVMRLFGLKRVSGPVPIERATEMIHPEDRERVGAALALAVRGEGSYDLDHRMLRSDGNVVWVHAQAELIHAAGGGPVTLLGTVTDITARMESERARHESEEMLRELAANMPEMVWIWEAKTEEFVYLSPAVERVFGRRLSLGKSTASEFFAALHPDDAARALAGAKEHPLGGYDGEFRVVRPDGTVRWIHGRTFAIRDEAGEVHRVAGIGADISERKDAEERLLRLAHYDHLTDLPNRKFFDDSLDRVIAQASERKQVVAVLLLDLDRFKTVNDTLGHATGDELLRQAAGRLLEHVRLRDVVGRLGGDEFGLVLQSLDGVQGAGTVAGNILRALKAPFDIGGRELFLSASIGIAAYPADAQDRDSLLRYADTAMYQAKAEGRATYRFYTARMNAHAAEKLEMEGLLRRAIERDEFLLHYQPKLDLRSGKVVGAEALLRWQRPGVGMVSPGEFIPLLEETGLIVPVGEWVLGEACRQLRAWADAGIESFSVAVNLSGVQFGSAELVQRIRRAVADQALAPSRLELEITESAVMTNPEVAAAALAKLSEAGFRVSVDDFGTGYSSLSYLKRFPISAIKIDQSFVRNITTDPDDAAIASAVIGIGHGLGLMVIAEGVETAEQQEYLRARGCDQVQGYLIARPLAAADLAEFLRRHATGNQ